MRGEARRGDVEVIFLIITGAISCLFSALPH